MQAEWNWEVCEVIGPNSVGGNMMVEYEMAIRRYSKTSFKVLK